MNNSAYDSAKAMLKGSPKSWLVTGAAGFIGSHLTEELLKLGQKVIAVDNFVTGKKQNIEHLLSQVETSQHSNFEFIEADLKDFEACKKVSSSVEIVLHQAAIGSVPISMERPLLTHENNVSAFINILQASQENSVQRFVYASSSAVYGDDPKLPKAESDALQPLSPYAASKLINETYASAYSRSFGIETVGLRYFNVFGERQDPDGAYAAVIPKWFKCMVNQEAPVVFGDGQNTRDFCYVGDTVQANLLAATQEANVSGKVFNVACGQKMSLNELIDSISSLTSEDGSKIEKSNIRFEEFRQGDIKHSWADISLAQNMLGYEPEFTVEEGLQKAKKWYLSQSRES